VVVIVALVLLLRYASSNRSGGTNPITALTRQPVIQRFLNGQMVVSPGQYRYWTVTITPEMTDAQLIGHFHTEGGAGNDIQAVVADQSEFENWKNGHQAKVYYSTDRVTNGQFTVHVGPGTYVIALSNTFSALSQKIVTGEIELRYLK